MAWLLAYKLEMTRVIKWDNFIPVTLLKVPTLKVVYKKDVASDWYNALVVGILKDGADDSIKDWNKALSFNKFSRIREFRLEDASSLNNFNVWDDVTLDLLEWVSEVEITSVSKGKGFAGAMKRHNFSWGRATHGSKFHRALGSIGNRKPRRTHKGKKMHGHMGNEQITLKNISVEIVNKNLNVLGLKGPVPGARKSLVMIKF